MTTFIDKVLSGHAFHTDIDDWVDTWHDAPQGSHIASMALHEYLGMEPDEYALWVERPAALRFIIAAHKAHTSTAIAEMMSQVVAAAARADDDAEAASVVQWLQQTGRL